MTNSILHFTSDHLVVDAHLLNLLKTGFLHPVEGLSRGSYLLRALAVFCGHDAERTHAFPLFQVAQPLLLSIFQVLFL